MRRIGHIQETPGDIEVVALKLTAAEHNELHNRLEQFINDRPVIFPGKTVKSLKLSPNQHPNQPASPASTVATTQPETWMSVIIHHPACACVGTCTPL